MSEYVITDQNFETEVLNAQTPAMVDFWASWCGPCRQLSPMVEKLAQDYLGKVRIGKLNVDENPDTPQRFSIQGIPTLLFFKNGELASRLVGLQSEQTIKKALDALI